MTGLINGMVSMGLSMLAEHKQRSEAWKDRILAQWNESANYPRKRKKRVRKGLMIEWACASYDPLEMLG